MTTKDWTGNSKAIYSCHGASNHSETEREANDYYATPPSNVYEEPDYAIAPGAMYHRYNFNLTGTHVIMTETIALNV